MIEIKNKKFDEMFIWQKDSYSCGVACFATILNLYGLKEKNYSDIKKILEPCKKTGTSNKKMIDMASKNPHYESSGENTYNKEIAIANITILDEGHYVIFLCQENNNNILYYCPYYHQMFLEKLDKINWVSQEGFKNWSVNFKSPNNLSVKEWLELYKTKKKFISPLLLFRRLYGLYWNKRNLTS